MSEALYRKYRPRKFSEVIGQQHIVQTLSNAVKHNRIGHAYLFTGPRGTGKTTVARVLAKAVNCQKRKDSEPCEKCEVCENIAEGRSLDIIEIDAASNTGVDNIRELRETVKLPPTQAPFKVYIIDEVHMLSAGAFNALLKTLEEPPAHVIFILATTAIHKVPETIISRCQRFDFSRLSLEQIIRKLSAIAKAENVSVEKNALEMIAISAEGGMRDAESLLAQIIALEDKNITSREVEEILGAGRHQSVEIMAGYILENNSSEALSLVNKISSEGVNLEVFHKSLLNYFRQLMLVSVSSDLAELFSLELTREQMEILKNQASGHSTSQILHIINSLIETQQNIRSSFIPQLPLELAIIESTQPRSSRDEVQDTNPDPTPNIPEKPITTVDRPKQAVVRTIPKKANTQKNSTSSDNISLEAIKDKWNEILAAIKPHNHSLIAFLSNCQPVEIDSNTLTIATHYTFYKDKLNEKKNKLTIESVIAKILGSAVRVKFVTEEEAGVKLATRDKQQGTGNGKDDSLLNKAMNIMGGRLVGDPPERRG